MLGLRLVHSFVSPLIPVGARELAFVLVMTGGLLIGHAWTFHLVDPRGWDFVGLGRSGWQPDRIARSALAGAMGIAIPVCVLLAAGWMAFVPSDDGRVIRAGILSLGVLVPAALWEELFVRGYAFAAVREVWGSLPAIIVTSLVFGMMHFLNQGASLQAVVVVCLGGLFLGMVRERTRSLYAAWAAHLAWNAVLVVILHATVSGITMATPDYRLVDSGPDWATGGEWGPEGGYFAAAGLVFATLYAVKRWTRRPSGDAHA